MPSSDTSNKKQPALDIVHAIPGRTRLRARRLKGNPRAAQEAHTQLSAINKVHKVHVNPATGSVILHHDPSAIESLEFLFAVASALGLSMAEMEGLPEMLEGLEGLAKEVETMDATTSLARIGKDMNARIAEATGGQLDIKSALPMLLVLLGARSLLASEVVAFPKWYDYWWFAFGVYFTLNPGQSNPQDTKASAST